jgi:hypothetical protein
VIQLAISVEGQTKEEFVNELLAHDLRELGIEATPILLGGLGGDVTLERLSTDMKNPYWSEYYATSLVDFHGFQDKGSRTVEALEKDILNLIGRRVGSSLDRSKVFPYV